ncbi:MAG: virulence RhuM family protein [Planctomycetaceae bacterium]|jgi:hypothetical protein|nr:virulence RhuM family protein [Planctomycetaceae bacterium]
MNKLSKKTENIGKTCSDKSNDPNRGEIIIYQTPDGSTNLDVRLEAETVWLTQEQMSELFQRTRTVISKHIRNIFAEGELQENVVCAKFAHTTKHGAIEGKTQTSVVQIYNLDVVISVGYRVKSQRGTQFRIWANRVLKDYLIKGYVVNQRGDPFAERSRRLIVVQIEIRLKR